MGTSLNGLTPAATYQGLIKFGNNSAISATLRYLSDGLGNDLPISVASSSVGINTITGSALFNIKGTGASSSSSSFIVQNSAGNNSIIVTDDGKSLLTANLSNDAPLQVNNSYGWTGSYVAKLQSWLSAGSEVAYLMANGRLNLNANVVAQTFSATQPSTLSDLPFKCSATGGGNGLYFPATNVTAIATNATERMRIDTSGNMGIGVTPTSRLQIKGSGATSATTTLLAQNSSATQLFKLTDDGKVTLGTGTTGTALLDVAIGSGSTPPLRLKGYSDASTAYLISLGTESFPQMVFFTMVNGNLTIKNQFDGFDIALKAWNGGIMVKNSGAIGIGTDTPVASAKMQLDSTTQGFLLPRMTQAQITAIASPANALMVYNTDINHICYYDSINGWRKLNHSAM